MPRCARVKSVESMYHVMVKSISDTLLFKNDDDKDKYLEYFKKYQDKHGFKVYAYCLMDNHAHFIIDANGADISTIMHGINQSYAQYFNIKHERQGHLFKDRFKSVVIMDDRYLITLSGYIHNNPSDIVEYHDHIERYKYSSLGVYLGLWKDILGLLDLSFILQYFSKNPNIARGLYIQLLKECNDPEVGKDIEFSNELSEYRSERTILKREFEPDEIVKFVSNLIGIESEAVRTKNSTRVTEMRALCVYMIRYLCNFKCKDICTYIGGICQSRVSMLSNIGLELVHNNEIYRYIIRDFIRYCASL